MEGVSAQALRHAILSGIAVGRRARVALQLQPEGMAEAGFGRALAAITLEAVIAEAGGVVAVVAIHTTPEAVIAEVGSMVWLQ